MELKEIVARQQAYFRTGKTRPIGKRIALLIRLKQSILKHEEDLYEAFYKDLGKGRAETYMAEISMVLEEISHVMRNLSKWARPKRVRGTLGTWPAKSRIYREPYGIVLVLAPWNYPLLLALSPVVGAIAAGNCVVLKCSKSSPNCAEVIATIMREAFKEEEAYCVDATLDYDTVLQQDYQYIFFTGSPRVGKTIMKRAAEDLIPVSLELGGKSPCIVTDSANLRMAAKRIVWGKLLNAGQTCITVDYLLVDEKVKDKLLTYIRSEIAKRYPDAAHNPNYPRIINAHHYERLMGLIERAKAKAEASDGSRAVFGGEGKEEERRIAPAIFTGVTWEDEIMEEEIFGPILPVITYQNLDEAVEKINDRPHPLATYIFTENRALAHQLLKRIPFGGGCVNDTILHISNPNMPFGGVGNSGMGGYHGKYSFETFSHRKSVVENTTKLDVPIRYGPLTDAKWKVLRMIL
ncbi:aldehyde dehydrogenase (NAD+) [Lachnospiraceae bacterium XBB1006]|nr:aldehyde dehydrogenase (NAD+) [Lachnospiraceae bacterium XBB1006]